MKKKVGKMKKGKYTREQADIIFEIIYSMAGEFDDIDKNKEYNRLLKKFKDNDNPRIYEIDAINIITEAERVLLHVADNTGAWDEYKGREEMLVGIINTTKERRGWL